MALVYKVGNIFDSNCQTLVNTVNCQCVMGKGLALQLKILCFATKEHWKNKSQYNWIIRGLQTFREKYKEWGITSIAFPKLGCTNGGLEWWNVQYYMDMLLRDLDIRVEIWVPEKSDLPKMAHEIQVVKNTGDFII